jgi:hypothetical protein
MAAMIVVEWWNNWHSWFGQLAWWQIVGLFVGLGSLIFLSLRLINWCFDQIDEMSGRKR